MSLTYSFYLQNMQRLVQKESKSTMVKKANLLRAIAFHMDEFLRTVSQPDSESEKSGSSGAETEKVKQLESICLLKNISIYPLITLALAEVLFFGRHDKCPIESLQSFSKSY